MSVIKPLTYELWGDSHFDDLLGIGARKAFEYESHFRQDIELKHNRAKAGSVVRHWIDDCLNQETLADVVVVSSGFNEGVSITWGLMTIEDVEKDWKRLITEVKRRGSHILWVPNQYKWKRANEFDYLEKLSVLALCLGSDMISWDPLDEEVSRDGVHYTYEASHYLCKKVMSAIVDNYSAPSITT